MVSFSGFYMYIVCCEKTNKQKKTTVKSLWLYTGSSQDRVKFCSRQEEAWLESRDYSIPAHVIAGVRKGFLPVKQVWWMEQWDTAGPKAEQTVAWHWSWAGGGCWGGVAVVGWALQWSLLHVNHSLVWGFLLLISLLLLFFLLISVLFPVNSFYLIFWCLFLFPPILLSILSKGVEGYEVRVSMQHMIWTAFWFGSTKLENTIPKSWWVHKSYFDKIFFSMKLW